MSEPTNTLPPLRRVQLADVLVPTGTSAGMASAACCGQQLGTIPLHTLILHAVSSPMIAVSLPEPVVLDTPVYR